MTTTITVAPSQTISYISVDHKAYSSSHQPGPESSNLVVLPSSHYLSSNLSVIRDVETPGPELARAFERVATQIIAQGKSKIGLRSKSGTQY
jgi:hypothetical protein